MCANNSQAFKQAYSPNNSGLGNMMAGVITAAHQKRMGGGAPAPGGSTPVAAADVARYMAVRPAFSQSAGPRLDNRLGA